MFYSYNIDYFIRVLEGSFAPHSIDDKSKEKIKELFSLLDGMKPTRENSERSSFWIRVSNGTLKDYTEKYIKHNYFEEDEDDDLSTEEGRKKWREKWKGYARDDYQKTYKGEEYKWYRLDALYHTNRDGEPFYGVVLNHSYILSVGDPNSRGGYDIDATEFIGELMRLASETVSLIKEGKYEEWLSELPFEDRYGTIGRKTYWDIFPDLRDEFRAGVTEEEIAEFVRTAETAPEKYNPAMTARDFFEACEMCYKAAGYEPRKNRYNDSEEERARYGGTTPKEIYSWYADGRDDGLCNVPLDDAEEFEKWTKQKGDYFVFNGHHPYEIVGSGSLINSVHLYPMKSDKGWEFVLSSSRAGRSTEMVRMFLAMRHAGLPVAIMDASELVARYTETDNIGILPKSVGSFGPYAHQRFPMVVSDVTELPDEKDEKYREMCEKAEWIKEVVPEFE